MCIEGVSTFIAFPCRSEFLDQELVQPAMPFRAVLDKAQVAGFSFRMLRTVMRVLFRVS